MVAPRPLRFSSRLRKGISKLVRSRRASSMGAISLVLLLRYFGGLQSLEWKWLDVSLRNRPAEARDPNIVIVGVDDDDIEWLGHYPIEDQQLADIINEIQSDAPRAIAVDFFRDFSVGDGSDALRTVFLQQPNVIGVDRVLDGSVKSLPGLPEAQVGFADVLLDADGFVRRSLLGTLDDEGNYRLSMTVHLASIFLAVEGLQLDYGIKDPNAMRFGSTELTAFAPNQGGYIGNNAGGQQVLVNFRSGPAPFKTVSLRSLMQQELDPGLLTDKIVLLGLTANSIKDVVNSAAVQSSNPGLVNGIEFQAHAISQITEATLRGRPLLWSLPDYGEYGLILLFGLGGLWLSQKTRTPSEQLIVVGLVTVAGVAIAHGALTIWGAWLPIVPGLAALTSTGVVLYAFHVYDRGVQAQIQSRQQLIERSYDDIHNGPLNELAILQREVKSADLTLSEAANRIASIDHGLRQVYDALRSQERSQDRLLYLEDSRLPLDDPMHNVLHQVYRTTMKRSQPYFAKIRTFIIKFEPMVETGLRLSQRRRLARFLEEALLNIGKYAEGTTRVKVFCHQHRDHNRILVVDNGIGLAAARVAQRHEHRSGGWGQQQAEALARSLGGTFEREELPSGGTRCELRWPVQQGRWQQLVRFLQFGWLE